MAIKENVKCECCGRFTPNYGNTKYCSGCAVHIKELKDKIHYYKKKAKEMTRRVYGQDSGAERIRWPTKEENKDIVLPIEVMKNDRKESIR